MNPQRPPVREAEKRVWASAAAGYKAICKASPSGPVKEKARRQYKQIARLAALSPKARSEEGKHIRDVLLDVIAEERRNPCNQAVLAGVRRVLEKLDEDQPQQQQPVSVVRFVLEDGDNCPLIDGKQMPKLTKTLYRVLATLLKAKTEGQTLTKDDLAKYSKSTDALGVLTRLLKKDDVWKKVIRMAGVTGGGYGIC